MFSGTTQDSNQVCHFFAVSSVCLLVRVTMVGKNKAVVCCLRDLTTTTTGHQNNLTETEKEDR